MKRSCKASRSNLEEQAEFIRKARVHLLLYHLVQLGVIRVHGGCVLFSLVLQRMQGPRVEVDWCVLKCCEIHWVNTCGVNIPWFLQSLVHRFWFLNLGWTRQVTNSLHSHDLPALPYAGKYDKSGSVRWNSNIRGWTWWLAMWSRPSRHVCTFRRPDLSRLSSWTVDGSCDCMPWNSQRVRISQICQL